MVKPFCKWAGGKRRMAKYIINAFPEKYKSFYEPFVGGGFIFFKLLELKRFKRAVLGDTNIDLMTAFSVIRDHVDNVIRLMKTNNYSYSKTRFLEIRKQNVKLLDPIERTARFLYLNHTSFNGLYRLNRLGQFNVPFGKYNNPIICNEKGLREVSEALKGVHFICEDFEQVLSDIKKGDAAYLDPPYIPISKTSKFTQYNGINFTESDHWRLRGCFGRLVNLGVRTVLTNSSAPLSYRLYEDFKIIELSGARVIGGPASYRNKVKELLIIGEERNNVK
jgi:DNA adenine methylase